MGTFLFYVAIFVLSIFLIQFGYTWWRVIGIRFKQSRFKIIKRSDVPQELESIFEESDRIFVPLDFNLEYCVLSENSHKRYFQVYLHKPSCTYAAVCPPIVPDGTSLFAVTFETLYSDGQIIATVDCIKYILLPSHPKTLFYDHYFGDVEKQWQSHLKTLKEIETSEKTPIVLAPQDRVRLLNEREEETYAFHEKTGYFLRSNDNGYRFHPLKAFRFTLGVLAGQRRRAKAIKLAQPIAARPDAQVNADYSAFETFVESEKTIKRGWLSKILTLSISVIASYIIFGFAFSWEFVPILIAVLLIHELGHLWGMRMFGFQDRQILFIPFLGAATFGHKTDAKPYQRLIVYMLGPVPGLILGTLAYYLLLHSASPKNIWVTAASTAMVLNYLNLLPLLPFDGGRIFELLLFSRFPRARFGMSLLSCLIIVAAGIILQDRILFIVAILLALNLRPQWHLSMAAMRVSKILTADADRKQRIKAIFQVLSQPPFKNQNSAVRIKTAKTVLEEISSSAPSLKTLIAGGTIYLSFLLIPILFFFVMRASLVQSKERATIPIPTQPYTYLCESQNPDASVKIIDEESITIFASFPSLEAASLAKQKMNESLIAENSVRIFGQTLVISSADANIKNLETQLSKLKGTTIVEDKRNDEYVEITITLTAPDETTASVLFAELDSYLSAPYYFYLRPPWLNPSQISEDQLTAEKRARNTYNRYRELTLNIYKEREYQDLNREFIKASIKKDNKGLKIAQQKMNHYHAEQKKAIIAKLLEDLDQSIDREMLLVINREPSAQSSKDMYQWGAEVGKRMGQIVMKGGEPLVEEKNLTATGFTQKEGRKIEIVYVNFNQTAKGLPVLAQYLCSQGISGFRYGINRSEDYD